MQKSIRENTKKSKDKIGTAADPDLLDKMIVHVYYTFSNLVESKC